MFRSLKHCLGIKAMVIKTSVFWKSRKRGRHSEEAANDELTKNSEIRPLPVTLTLKPFQRQ